LLLSVTYLRNLAKLVDPNRSSGNFGDIISLSELAKGDRGMGRPDDRSEEVDLALGSTPSLEASAAEPSAIESNAIDTTLRSMTQDLRNLQQDLVSQLHQDIRRLQAEKSRLLNDVEKLQNQHQAIQSQHDVALSRQQMAQQQAWAKQLALVLANHLQAALSQRLGQVEAYPIAGSPNLPQIRSAGELQEMQGSIASLDDTVNRTFAALRNDLNSYQSTLSQQLDRMQTLGQQGEAILEVLVSRISQQLQAELVKPALGESLDRTLGNSGLANSSGTSSFGEAASAIAPNPTYPANPAHAPVPPASSHSSPVQTPSVPAQPIAQNSAQGFAAPANQPDPQSSRAPTESSAIRISTPTGKTIFPTAHAVAPEPAVAPVQSMLRPRKLSQFQAGLAMILLSTLALSLHNVIVGIVSNPTKLFGVVPIGGFITIQGFGSSLFLLWMRMLIVVPLMAWLAGVLYPTTWRDIRYFFESKDRRLMGSVIGSGFFLFLSQVLIYISISQIGPAVAVTILFMYPIITVPLAWVLFGDRPNRFRVIVMATILTGVVLTAVPRISTTTSLTGGGIVAAILSGVFFACYLISMQISFRKLHPVPVSLIQFASIFVLTSISLIVLGIEVTPNDRGGLFMGGLVLGVLTLAGYLLNNFGVRLMGAARASIIAASGPVLTALLAFFVIPGRLTVLHPIQLLGILIVTLGVTALSFERILIQNRREARQARTGDEKAQ
jgi:drug/metabolite transporter (DMT)-like permease